MGLYFQDESRRRKESVGSEFHPWSRTATQELGLASGAPGGGAEQLFGHEFQLGDAARVNETQHLLQDVRLEVVHVDGALGVADVGVLRRCLEHGGEDGTTGRQNGPVRVELATLGQQTHVAQRVFDGHIYDQNPTGTFRFNWPIRQVRRTWYNDRVTKLRTNKLLWTKLFLTRRTQEQYGRNRSIKKPSQNS